LLDADHGTTWPDQPGGEPGRISRAAAKVKHPHARRQAGLL
jgi:hypothetical protein